MDDAHLTPTPPEGAPGLPSAAGRRRAVDLETSESAVAAAFGALPRPDAPEAVWQTIERAVGRQAVGGIARAERRPAWSPFRHVPFGRWGVASAALLLFALGVATAVELSHPVVLTPPTTRSAGAGGIDELTIVDDSRMALFHDVETFDDVGLAPGRLIADWGR